MKTPAAAKIESLTRDFVLTNDQLEKVASMLLNEFNEGLSRRTHQEAKVKMWPTYVKDVPSGNGKFEEGKFLALDLGGTNFRVLLIDINGKEFSMEHETFATPQEIMLGTGEMLFDHIAACMAKFLGQQGLLNCKLPLGFTFSFPCKQEGINKARLVNWTKGFACTDVEGQDVVQLLKDALARRNDINIDVSAVVNDTTGTLMSCAHKNRECRVGVIVGTGTNACYMESLENVETVAGEEFDPKRMIVNTEWGAFGDNGVIDFVRNDFDETVDENSLNKGKQLFEKMISGMYMGELTRVVIAHLCKKGLLFNGITTEKMLQRNVIDTSFVSFVESDPKGMYDMTRDALRKMDIHDATDDDCENIKLICSRVSTRAAYLVSAAIATILNKIKRPQTTVGVDGSVYRYHPHFHNLMEHKISELIHPEYKFDLVLSEDGSGRGAALVAATTVDKSETLKKKLFQ